MAFRLKLQESLSCPIGALLLGVGAGNGVQRICPVPVLFISLLYSGLFRGRAQRQRLGLGVKESESSCSTSLSITPAPATPAPSHGLRQ